MQGEGGADCWAKGGVVWGRRESQLGDGMQSKGGGGSEGHQELTACGGDDVIMKANKPRCRRTNPAKPRCLVRPEWLMCRPARTSQLPAALHT